jgi:hypothetical protein
LQSSSQPPLSLHAAFVVHVFAKAVGMITLNVSLHELEGKEIDEIRHRQYMMFFK